MTINQIPSIFGYQHRIAGIIVDIFKQCVRNPATDRNKNPTLRSSAFQSLTVTLENILS